MTRRKSLSKFLAEALARPGASQAQLARELGVTRSTVHLWATGKREAPERYRAALRQAAKGRKVSTPAQRTTKTGAPVRTRGTVVRKQLPGGKQYVQTSARSAFAAELGAAAQAGRAPTSMSVVLHGFRATDSPVVRARDRRVQVDNLTAEEIAALASGSKGALEDVITRAVQARNYSGGFTFSGAARFSFDTT
jgi:transcriptional regulator with XRE-family HTH domain